MWLATEGGLARFDGNSFAVFDKTNTPGLKYNRIAYISKGRDEKVYALSGKNDLIRIAGAKAFTGNLQEGENGPAGQTGIHPLQYWARGMPDLPDVNQEQERCFISLGKGGIAECLPDRVIFHHQSAPDQTVALKTDQLSNFFLIGEDLYYYEAPGRFLSVGPKGLKSCMLIGDILHRTEYNGTSHKVQVFWNPLSSSTLLYFDRAFYLLRSMPDGLLITEFICETGNINIDRICSSFYDEERGRLFLGSLIKGLYVLSRKQFITLRGGGLQDQDAYYAQVPFRHNSVLTSSLSVVGLDQDGQVFVRKNKLIDTDLSQVYTMARSVSGERIWIKDKDILYQLDSQLQVRQKWLLPAEISILYESGDGVLWIALSGKGIFRLDTKSAAAQPVYVAGEHMRVNCFQEGSNGDIWIGSHTGLNVLRAGQGPLLHVATREEKHIKSLLFQAPDLLWITTHGDGIYLYAGNEMTRFPEDKAGLLLTAHCIIPDNKGFLWLATNKGLFQASKNDLLAYKEGTQKELYYYFYSKELGFSTNEFNGSCQPYAARVADGYVSLPSLDGLVWFDPDKLVPELPDQGLFIDDITVDGQVQRYPRDTVRLPRAFNQLGIVVSTPYFGNRKNVQIFYTLIGKDGKSSWVALGTDRRIQFPALSSGTYRLVLRKLNGFGKGTYTEKQLVLTVAPWFYETWWFISLTVVLILLTLFFYVRMRMLYVVKTNRRLELRIALRTRKLMNTLRALESSEQVLRRQTQIQEMLIAAISHDIKTPMKYLTIASEKMQGLLDNKEYEPLPVFNKGIHETASKVYILLDNLLQYIRVQLKKGDIRIGPVHLHEIVQEKLLTFRNMAELHYTVIANEVSEELQINTNKELLGVIVHNLVDNAVKNTLKGRIVISTEPLSKGIALVITDSGKGIAQDMADWLNTPGGQEIDIDTVSGHMGMGLVIVKELALMINAQIKAERPAAGGTKICIFLLDHP